MLKLSKIQEKNKGVVFVIPGDFFESDNVKLKLSPITQKETISTLVREKVKNKKTGQLDDIVNMDKTRERAEELLNSHILGWEGIEEKYSPENVKIFMDNFGGVIVVNRTDQNGEAEEVNLSTWIAETCKAPENFYTDDSENLVSTSQV